MNWISEVRQRLYRREFRIQKPCWPELSAASPAAIPERGEESTADGDDTITSELPERQRRLVVTLATNLWRTRQKMIDPVSGEPPEHMRKAYRHVRSMWDALRESEIEIQDHTNQPFHLGQTLNAIAFEPRAGLSKDTVLETVKPTIYFRKRLIQMGEVIVGTPVS